MNKSTQPPLLKGETILITGPARSGKSEWAERLAHESQRQVMYCATAIENANDAEWTARIATHRIRRPATWQTVCVPIELATTLADYRNAQYCLLIDSLGTWTANLIELNETQWQLQVTQLFEQLKNHPALIIFVAEETGWGVIPAYPIGRLFRDRLGELIRRLGGQCDATYLVTGGYALELNRFGVRIE
ncbi:bifunctional adenosylcobinamide kinase/adenosylcobinamide-phosphate guanylyltransferase [Chromatium weissei]|nr:bifunctional adenosylcobinamide kinase/adenosylcobinamide-phosphate guanylyltransferase [Chromatium weissei]